MINKKHLKNFKIWLLILLLLPVNYSIVKYYKSGVYINILPIIAINITIIIGWVTIFFRSSSSNYKDKIMTKILIFSVLSLFLFIFIISNLNSSELSDLVKISFDNEFVKFRSNISFSPVSSDRTVGVFSAKRDNNVILDYDDSQELILKDGLYYKKGNLAPFSGVYYRIDGEEGNVKEGSSYLIGERLQKQIYENDVLLTDIYYRRSSDFGYWENNKRLKIIYNPDNNQKTRINYNTDGIKTKERIYIDDTKVKEFRYDEGKLSEIRVYDEYVESYYENGVLRFWGKMLGEYLSGEVVAYYNNGQLRYEGFFPSIHDAWIGVRIAESKTDYSPAYKNHLFLLSGISTDWDEDNPGIVSLNISGSELIYDDSWYLELEETPNGFLKSDSNQQNQVGDWVYYYKNGEVQAKGGYHSGFPVNDWEYYYDNGQLEAKGYYIKPGIKGGYWEYYYRNGQLKSCGYYAEPDDYEIESGLFSTSVDEPLNVFNKSLKNDIWEYYSESGELMARGRYLNGKKVGEWQVRDNQNDSFRIEEYKK